MTTLLQQAIAQIAHLPPVEQDSVAAWLLAELESERKWDELFSRSPDVLEKLARAAEAELGAGETLPLDIPDQ